MSTPFQIVLRTLGYFTVYKTAEEYLKAAEEEKEKPYYDRQPCVSWAEPE